VIPYDYRDTVEALVHKDLRLQSDGNRYCVPHRFVGRRLTVKADASSVTVYHRYQEIVSYARSWRRGTGRTMAGGPPLTGSACECDSRPLGNGGLAS
jgi:hypothetical protein